MARAVAVLQKSYPRIQITADVVGGLLDFLTWQWRQNRPPRDAVAQTCLVAGRIVPSAATAIVEPRVRPPAGARPGEAFGADWLRRSVATERLERKAISAKKKADDSEAKAAVFDARANATSSTRTKAKLTAQANEARVRAAIFRDDAEKWKRQAQESQAPGADSWRTVRPDRPPKPRRTAQDATCPPNQVGCALGLLGGVCGLPAPLVLASSRGSPVPQVARYCLTSADRLIPSHDARRGFVKRDDYPTDVQEREYHRDKAEQLKVLSTAANLIPELIFNGAPGAIDGLPVVTKEGIVLGGNGRAQALQLHYGQGGRLARDYLLDHAAQFGFRRGDIEKVPDPVVVRVIDTIDRDSSGFRRAAQELVRVLNVPLTQSLSNRAEAVAESRRISDEVLEILSVALADKDLTLADYLGSRASRTLADALRRASIITERNAVRMLGTDGFTDEGKRFIERVLTAALIPHTELLDRLGPATVATLAAGAPWLLGAAAAGDEWDLRKHLSLAAKDLADLRTQGAVSVDEYLRQGSMFGKPATSDDPKAEKLLRFLFDLSNRPTRFRLFARSYASMAAQNPINQASLFPSEQISPSAALDSALVSTR